MRLTALALSICVCLAAGSRASAQTAATAATPPPQQTPSPQVVAPAPRPPFPNRANEVLPSWLRVRGEFRERLEGFDNSGFNRERDDAYFLSRLRLNASFTGKSAGATIQVQDARVGGKTVGATGAPFTSTFDLRQAFVDVGSAKAPVAARLGRQEIAFGDQRLVGHAGWLNAARTFDAARLTFRSKPAQVDVFAASVVRAMPGELDKSGNGNRFGGTYVSLGRLVPQGSAEPYVFYRRDTNQRAESGAIDALEQVTAGGRFTGKLPVRLDYNVEVALQRGSLGPDSVRAWAGHWQLRETLKTAGAPHVTTEYNYASGDASPADGIRGTFDQLYPTAHDKYGLADQVGWRNIHDIRIGFDITPFKATPITVNYHSYWLAEKRDGLYAASGALLARVAAGAESARVGQEIDVQVSRPLFQQLALTAGYAHLFTGPFLKQATPGASYTGPFAMLTYVFLAEK